MAFLTGVKMCSEVDRIQNEVTRAVSYTHLDVYKRQVENL